MKTYLDQIQKKSNSNTIQAQNELDIAVKKYQSTNDAVEREQLFDEIYSYLKGLIKAMAFKQSDKSFSIELEDFEGIMHLVLVESLLKFEPSVGTPFQPFYIMNVRNEIKMTYRHKGYDIFDTTPTRIGSKAEADSFSNVITEEKVATQKDELADVETLENVDQIINQIFGDSERKKRIIRMFLNGFKRNEILIAIKCEGNSDSSVTRLINRTITKFKEEYAQFA